MAEKRTPLSSEGRLRVSKKIQKMMREEKKKPKEERREKDQVYRIAYEMERRGEL